MSLRFQWLVIPALTASAAVIVVSAAAVGRRTASPAALHDETLVVAGHEHITNRVYYEGIDPWQPVRVGVWDYARAKQGGVDVVIENIWADDAGEGECGRVGRTVNRDGR